MFGFEAADLDEGEPVEIWPDNEQAFNLFSRLTTQWRAGAGGLYGLDYGVAFSMMDRMALTPEQYDALEADMRIMEDEALATMIEGRDDE